MGKNECQFQAQGNIIHTSTSLRKAGREYDLDLSFKSNKLAGPYLLIVEGFKGNSSIAYSSPTETESYGALGNYWNLKPKSVKSGPSVYNRPL